MLSIILFAINNAFAAPIANCDIRDHMRQVGDVWNLADTGDRTRDGKVFLPAVPVAEGTPYVPAFQIQTVPADSPNSYVGLIGWYPPSDSSGEIVQYIIMMKRDGLIFGAPKGKTCDQARTLVIDFFAHMPK